MMDKNVFLERAAWSLEMLAKCIREEDIKKFDELTYSTDEVDEADNQICVNVDLCEVREILDGGDL